MKNPMEQLFDFGRKNTATPVKSLIKIRFHSHSIELAYYNDHFDLQIGDVVYVSGKKAGEAGVVTSVTTKFRIHTSDYEKVLAKLDLTFHGSFTRVQDKMVCFDIAIQPDQFASWVTPPVEKQKDDAEPDEVISGEGYRIDLNDIGSCEDLTEAIYHRAVDYCAEGNVKYLYLQNGTGVAFVEGNKWYRVDFHYGSDGVITDLFCDCPYSNLCKHEVAVALTLRMLLKQPQMENATSFIALDRWLFWQLAARADAIDI